MTLPSGSLRVRVYAGIDPLTGKKHHLTEVIPAGKDAEKLAEKARTRMLAEVDDRRAPRTKVPVTELMDRHLELLDVEETTLPATKGTSAGTSSRCSGTFRSAVSTVRPSISSHCL